MLRGIAGVWLRDDVLAGRFRVDDFAFAM